jgi:hypothetical protein
VQGGAQPYVVGGQESDSSRGPAFANRLLGLAQNGQTQAFSYLVKPHRLRGTILTAAQPYTLTQPARRQINKLDPGPERGLRFAIFSESGRQNEGSRCLPGS